MFVMSDSAGTPENEASILWFAAETDGPTTNDPIVEIYLDANGDGVEDYVAGAPELPEVDADPLLTEIERVTGDLTEPTGQASAWVRTSADGYGWDGYLVGLDWKALGLTQAAFAFQMSIDDANWVSIPDTGFSAMQDLTLAPTAPRAVTAVAGDRRATVRWAAPAWSGTSPVTKYTVVAVPGGRSCVTTGRSCVVTGLTNQKAYRFQVKTQNAYGASPASVLSKPVVPKPYVQVIVKAKSKASKLKVDVNPNKGKGFWKFTVQKRSTSSWTNVGTYTTKGKKETRTLNLPKGTYRVVVAEKYGYQTTTSGSVTLVK